MGCLFKPRYTKNGQARVSQVWWVQYRSAGRRIRESTGTRDRAEASRFLKRREGAAAEGKRSLEYLLDTATGDMWVISRDPDTNFWFLGFVPKAPSFTYQDILQQKQRRGISP